MPKWKDFGGPPIYNHIARKRAGFKPYAGETNRLNKSLAEAMLDIPWKTNVPDSFEYQFNPFYRTEVYRKGKITQEDLPIGPTGGIFNLEYSPDGRILSAACERKNILIFDPLQRRVVRNIENAHQDCVNCVRFLDTRSFASCSDDTTVALWDVRNLKSRVRTLRGHSNWVKNIEYSPVDNVLVTSGFDGAIYTWDFNRFSENSPEFKKVFYTNGLMRMRLTPDASKMVISTMNGYLAVIHDLNLEKMSEDLAGFKPNMYRLMQLSGKALELAVNYTRLFHTKRNRVELISDFPEGNDPEIISSLRLHPQGWVAASRNTSSDESSEWCCVHDIQSVETNEEDDEPIKDQRALNWMRSPNVVISARSSNSDNRAENVDADAPAPSVQRFRAGRIEIISTGTGPTREEGSSVVRIDLTLNRDRDSDDQDEDRDTGQSRDEESNVDEPQVNRTEEVNVDGTNFMAAESMAALDLLGELSRDVHLEPGSSSTRANAAQDDRLPNRAENTEESEQQRRGLVINIARQFAGVSPAAPAQERNERSGRNESEGFLIIGGSGSRRVVYFGSPAARRAQQEKIPKDAKIHKNIPRLTHYITESNTGRGFIKEQCFSPCGRFLASPFGFGVRVLAWNEGCYDLSSCVPESPVSLYEVGHKSSHSDVVLSCAFSPSSWMLVTGCLGGRISWHQPVF